MDLTKNKARRLHFYFNAAGDVYINDDSTIQFVDLPGIPPTIVFDAEETQTNYTFEELELAEIEFYNELIKALKKQRNLFKTILEKYKREHSNEQQEQPNRTNRLSID